MKVIFALAVLFTVAYGFKVNTITGTTPPPIKCPNDLCYYRKDGNYKYVDPWTHKVNKNYFLQCSGGVASCQACFPLHLIYREDCDQCLKTEYEKCATTEPWYPATTFSCPDICPKRGYYFSGNINDPYNPYQYVACWKGRTVGCVACPKGLVFNKRWNACVGKKDYKKKQPYGHSLSYTRRGYGPSYYRRRRSHGHGGYFNH